MVVSTSEQQTGWGGGWGGGVLPATVILTLNGNREDLPPLPAPTVTPVPPRQGWLAVPQGSLYRPPQGSQGTGGAGEREPCGSSSSALKDPAEAALVKAREESPR